MNALLHERAEGHGLTHSPIDGTIFQHLSPVFQNPSHSFVNNEVLSIWRSSTESLANVSQGLFMNAGVAHLQGVFALKESRPGAVKPVLVVDLPLSRGLFVRVLADLLVLVNDFIDLFFGHDALIDKLLAIDVHDVGVLLDDGVHDGLREHGFVNFVVTVLTVADQIDNDVLVEGGAILGGDAADVDDSLGVVGVDVENGSVGHFTDVSAVRRGS